MKKSASLRVLTMTGCLLAVTGRLSAIHDFDIVTTNQDNAGPTKKIQVFDNDISDWNSSAALIWQWQPTTANGYSTSELAAWGSPNGVKLRDNDTNWGGRWILSASSGGLATVASYPFGNKKWAYDLGSVNPHDIELLPNGNVAVAASGGDFVRVYAASQGASNGTHAEFPLTDAHAVLWDPTNNWLWALGLSELKALSVGGTAASPTLTAVTGRAYSLPTAGGHSLAPYWGDANKLWVSTGSRTYIFDKTAAAGTDPFTLPPGPTTGLMGGGNKAVSAQPSGIAIVTRPDSIKSGLAEPSTQSTWTTAYVDVYSTSTGSLLSSYHRTGADWYKGYVFWPEYQYTPATLNDLPIIATNQANNQVEIYDYYSTNWESTTDIIWSWKPTTSNGFNSTEVSSWSQPTEARVRANSTWGGEWLATSSSGGLVAVVSYPGKTRQWALNVGGNPTSVELLPDGNVAIANQSSNWLRVYTSSQSGAPNNFVSVSLSGARSVLWDPALSRLWVASNNQFTAYAIGGTAAAPTLTEDTAYRKTLTENAYYFGPYEGDTNRLWVATASHVYTYDKTTKALTLAPGSLDRASVRSITHQASGIVVLTRPDSVKSPTPPDPSTLNSWTTSYVDYYTPTGLWRTAGHKAGASYFKGVVYCPDYQ
jgi:hypothetical protein